MEIKIKKELIDTGFGFPVRLKNVPMIKVRGMWTPNINYNHLTEAVLYLLAFKPSRLTGSEIKFIRTHFEMTLQVFADRFCVTHVAVLKWEKLKDAPTVMTWTTEKDIRLFVLCKLRVKSGVMAQLYNQLETKAAEKPKLLDLDVGDLAA